MYGPKTFSVELDGVSNRVSFNDFDVMTDDAFDSPLVTGLIRLCPLGGKPIELEYEEWIDELVDGNASRWETGEDNRRWNDALPALSRHEVDELRTAIDQAIYRRLNGSTWRVHL